MNIFISEKRAIIIKNYIKKKRTLIYIVSPIPLLANLLYNIHLNQFTFSLQNSSSFLELINISLAFLFFIFYLLLGKVAQGLFNTKYLTTAIVLFWILIFGIDNIFLFFTKNIKFQEFLTGFLLVGIILLYYKKSNFKSLSFLIVYNLFVQSVVAFLQTLKIDLFLDISQVYTSDESRLWYPTTEIIYNQNYFDALANSPYPGYGLFTSYVNSVNTFFFAGGLSEFKFLPGISYLIIFLFFYFIYEISIHKKTFLIYATIYLCVILTSHWFTYVFFGSLLSEVIAAFSFGILFTEIATERKKYNKNKILFFMIMFGFLYFTRQFISIVVLIYPLYLTVSEKKINYLIALVPFLIKLLQSRFITNNIVDPYITEENFRNIYFNFENIWKTIVQFALDKPISYTILLFFLLTIFSLKNIDVYKDFYLILSLNTLLVFLLVVFIWNKTDVQSTYRYLMATFYLTLYPMCSIMDRNFEIDA